MSVAVVDISQADSNKAAQELVDACSTLGFVFIEGSEFTQADIDQAFDLSKEYFKLPVEEKAEVPITPENHGYSRINLEVLDPENQPKGDPKEAFNFGQFLHGRPQHELPKFFESKLPELTYLESKCHALCVTLLKLLAKGLKIEADKGGDNWFADRHRPNEKSGCIFRFLYYHAQNSASPEEQIRAGAHTDYGSLTLLFQKEGEDGLEVLSPVTKEWTRVKFVPSSKPGAAPPIIVNVADLLSFWTAGILKSSIHRVRFLPEAQKAGRDRYSIVYFCHPENDALLEPVPSPIVAQIEARGANRSDRETITAKQHLDKRLAATYGWKK
ncbi:putative dioxygenase [Sugiyamaella lignohabitans]|uniref:Putative dioxygenase n=1 Tax=Sugiyamaella lignohabitans TaxID=796027 RepID=A0A167CXL7_9ASCO|nr:putative dioxygenase [Sugiyamaella lignohabitans]ANB12231.1 putative dioxygenase [Sugiyamaella lignohabitans]